MSSDQSTRPFVGPQTMPTDATGWWETERAAFVRSRIAALTEPGDVVVDVGCGRGTMLSDPQLYDRTSVCVDGYVWPEWTNSGPQLFVCAAAHALPFRDGSFDLVGSFDVLEHLEDDAAGLGEQRRVLRRDGHLVTAVPADPRLWSPHDEEVGHHRRYTAETFHSVAADCGVVPSRTTYFFSFLWLPARVLRNSGLRRQKSGPSTGPVARVVRSLISAVCATERWLLARWSLPIGSSLWIESSPTRTDHDGAS